MTGTVRDRSPGAPEPPGSPTEPTPGPTSATASVSYMPGLDGLRAVAVIAVFLFHGGVGAVSGGYLAVSTFFTLSGFLITLLLCAELGSRGRIAVASFWERRLRRLLPAAALGVALAALVTVLVGTASQRRSFGADGAATFFDVANWRFVLADQSYGQLFETPSALQHAWSLAIEAQFYWLYPLVFIGVMRLVRGDRRRFGSVLAVLFAASIALTRWGGFGADRIYYGTDTRAAELLAGALLGLLVAGRSSTAVGSGPAGRRRVLSGVSLVAAGLLVAAWTLTPRSAGWIGDGGLGAYAVVSCVVILGASVAGTPLARVLGLRPLRWLGRISYGFYLYHWPILLLVAPERVPGPPVVRLVVAAGITTVLAAVSYRVVERPIRTRSQPFERVGLGVIVGGCAAIALIPSLAVARTAPAVPTSTAAPSGALLSDTDALGAPDDRAVVGAGAVDEPGHPVVEPSGEPSDPVGPAALTPRPYVAPSRPLRVVVVGDSVAYELAPLLDGWGGERGIWKVASHARIGCGIVRGGATRSPWGDTEFGPECREWVEEWPRLLDEVQPDAVVLVGGLWDSVDRRMVAGDAWRGPGDPEHDRLIVDEYDLALRVLTAGGVPVIWLDHPPLREDGPEASVLGALGYDHARMARLDEIQAEVAGRHPATRVVRTNAFLQAWPGGAFDEALRPDGIHFTGPGAQPFVDWLGPEVLDAYWSVVDPG